MKKIIICTIVFIGVSSNAANMCVNFFNNTTNQAKKVKATDAKISINSPIKAKPEGDELTSLQIKLFNRHFTTLVDIAEKLNLNLDSIKKAQVFEAIDLLSDSNHLEFVMFLDKKVIYIDDGSKNVNPYSSKNWGELSNDKIGFLKLPNQFIELIGYGYLTVNKTTDTFKYSDKTTNLLKQVAAHKDTPELFKNLVENYDNEIQQLLYDTPLSSQKIIESNIVEAQVQNSGSKFIMVINRDSQDIYFFSKDKIAEFGGRKSGLIHFETMGFTNPGTVRIKMKNDQILEYSHAAVLRSISKKGSPFHNTQVKHIVETLQQSIKDPNADAIERKYLKLYSEFYKNNETQILELLDNESLKIEDIQPHNIAIGLFTKSGQVVYIFESPFNDFSYVFSPDGAFSFEQVNMQKHGHTLYTHKGHGLRIKSNVGFIKSKKEEAFELTDDEYNLIKNVVDRELGL